MKKSLIKTTLIYLAISLIPYVLFYWPLLDKNIFIGGSDPLYYYYPTRFYLWESLKNFHFPFWTERIFSGFPIYADSERGFLNPLNILSVFLFGPLNSYKFLHFVFYTCGSFAFINFLRKRGFSVLGVFCANIVYYFSFFHLYHQQHFNFILTTFMIPVGLFFVDNYISTRKLRWWLSFAGLTSLLAYFGAFQALVLFIIPSFVYFIIYAHKSMPLKMFLNLLLVYFLLVTALTLPQVLPSGQLYLNSYRGEKNISFTEGSFNPAMLANSIYPYSFGSGPNYKWNNISGEYFIHETYVYSGIVAFFLAVLGFVALKDKKLKLFIYLNILIYLVLGFIKYIPLLNSYQLPIVGMFRYWGRANVLFSLGIACLSGYFISFPRKLTLSEFVKNRLLVYTALAFFVFFLYSLFAFDEVRRTLVLAFNSAVIRDAGFYWWIALSVIGFIGCFVLSFYNRKKLLSTALVFLVVLDLYCFGASIVNGYLRSTEQIVPQDIISKTAQYKNTRIVMLNPLTYWNKGLYFSHWSLFGYSQYASEKYKNYLEGLGFSLKGSGSESDMQSFKNVGVEYVLDQGGSVIAKFPNTVIGEFSGIIENYKNEEGSFMYKINSLQEQTLNTRISNYPGWEVRVNGEKVKVLKNATFLTFAVPQGGVVISIKFIPKILYFSTALSVLVLGVSLVFIKWLLVRYNQKL